MYEWDEMHNNRNYIGQSAAVNHFIMFYCFLGQKGTCLHIMLLWYVLLHNVRNYVECLKSVYCSV